MDLTPLKDTLGDQFEPLASYIADLIGQRDAARAESITGRKGLKAEVEKLRASRTALFDRLGIADDDELDALPDLKGQADAAKVYEAKLKRLERELGEKNGALDKLQGQYRESRQSALLTKALAAHEWVDHDVVELAIKAKLTWEEDQPFYQTEKGPLPIDEGVKLFAAEKPALLKHHGAGGSGYTKSPNGSTPNPFAKETFNLTQQGVLVRDNPILAQTLRGAARTTGA